MWLAGSLPRGIKGLTYYCFQGSPAGPEDLTAIVRHPYVPHDGLYDEVRHLNELITQNSELLNGLNWHRTFEHENSQLDVQLLSSEQGQHFAFITNFSYEQGIETTVSLPQLQSLLSVKLDPGQAVLVNLATLDQVRF